MGYVQVKSSLDPYLFLRKSNQMVGSRGQCVVLEGILVAPKEKPTNWGVPSKGRTHISSRCCPHFICQITVPRSNWPSGLQASGQRITKPTSRVAYPSPTSPKKTHFQLAEEYLSESAKRSIGSPNSNLAPSYFTFRRANGRRYVRGKPSLSPVKSPCHAAG